MKFLIFIDIKMQAAMAMSIVLVINFKMPTVVGILKFMSSVEHEKGFITSSPGLSTG